MTVYFTTLTSNMKSGEITTKMPKTWVVFFIPFRQMSDSETIYDLQVTIDSKLR